MLCCFVSVFIYTKMTLSTAFGVLDMYLFIDQHLFIDQSALGRWCGLYHTGRLNFSQAFVPVIILLRADVWVQVNLISFSLPLWYGIEPLTSCVCQTACKRASHRLQGLLPGYLLRQPMENTKEVITFFMWVLVLMYLIYIINCRGNLEVIEIAWEINS